MKLFISPVFIIICLIIALPVDSNASSYLLFLEGQTVAGYSDLYEEMIYYSHGELHPMQKPSIGFDYIQRLSATTRDWGMLALQARVNYNHNVSDELEVFLFNAYFKYKTSGANFWIGHNKPALGLNSYLDNHVSLLSDFTMNGFNYDRDWGFGMERDADNYNLSLSVTTASGMKLSAEGSYLISTRIGFGDFRSDNYTIGLSANHGEILETMGYHIMHDSRKHEQTMWGFDTSYKFLNYELKTDYLMGEFLDKKTWSALGRISVYLLEEERMSFEPQILFSERLDNTQKSYSLSLNYRILSTLTARALYNYDESTSESKYVIQFYYLKPLNLF